VKRVRFAGAQVQFFFTVEDEEGDVDTVPTQLMTVKSKDWRRRWASKGADEIIADALTQLEAPTESEPAASTNGKPKAKTGR
jgi:hypothetical protein